MGVQVSTDIEETAMERLAEEIKSQGGKARLTQSSM
jgi:hypothetical protein